MTSLPVPDSPVMRTLASDGATCSARRSTGFIAGSRNTRVLVSSETAASTAAISSASGGRGTYSWAPARIALAAAAGSGPMPQAITGTEMRSCFRLLQKLAISRFTSTMTMSAPWPERSAVSAASISSTWATLAPLSSASLPAVEMCPSRVPTMRSRMPSLQVPES